MEKPVRVAGAGGEAEKTKTKTSHRVYIGQKRTQMITWDVLQIPTSISISVSKPTSSFGAVVIQVKKLAAPAAAAAASIADQKPQPRTALYEKSV